MKRIKITLLVGILSFVSCKTKTDVKIETTTIKIKNTLDFDRNFETIEISKKDLHLKGSDSLSLYVIEDENKNLLEIQYEDTTNDGKLNILLFQPKVKANSNTTYILRKRTKTELFSAKETCYSRFVPERTDDYAWENDKVAFRVYGPTAQKMIEDGIEGGTLSSGVDCWLKRVDYPIINKWYKKYSEKTGTYHEDTGEGLDNFHVGTSRGCGGIAVKSKDNYFLSKNFIQYKTITTGPIRTQFSLEYADWDANGKLVQEKRIITLDKGNQLSKFEIYLKGIDTISIGLTLHKNDGTITKNKEKGWISYWEKLDDSEIGTAVLVSPQNNILDFNTFISKTDDTKNQYVKVAIANNKILYYAGFGWKKATIIQDNDQWTNYLNTFSLQLQSPLEIAIP